MASLAEKEGQLSAANVGLIKHHKDVGCP